MVGVGVVVVARVGVGDAGCFVPQATQSNKDNIDPITVRKD
jgi:hypothetical protein